MNFLYHCVMNQTKFSSWIFDSFRVSPEGLGLYRIFCGLFLLLFLLPSAGIYPFISTLPDAFFQPPPGPMALFDGFPSDSILLLLHTLLILSTCSMMLGWQTKKTSILTGVLLLTIKGFIYSVGKINHDFLIIIVPVLMAFSGWGKAYSVDTVLKRNTEKVEGWTLTLLALFIGFMFFTAGFSKLIGGWLNVDSQAALGHAFKQYYVVGRQDFWAGSVINLTSPFFWECADYLTVIFEMGFLAAVFHPRTTRIFLCFAVLFHFCLMMVLNISFLPNILAYAAFLNWTWIDNFIKKKAVNTEVKGFIRRWLAPIVITLALIGGWAIIQLIGSKSVLQADWGLAGFIVIAGSVPIALYHLFDQLKRWILERLK